jgi:hypothetical protein
MVYEVEIEERRRYTILADGMDSLDARRDAVETYCRLIKSGDLVPHTVLKPRVLEAALFVKRRDF